MRLIRLLLPICSLLVSVSSYGQIPGVPACGQQLSVGASYRGVAAKSNAEYQGLEPDCDTSTIGLPPCGVGADDSSGQCSYGERYQCVEFIRRFYSLRSDLENRVDTSGWRGLDAADFLTRDASGKLTTPLSGFTAFPNAGNNEPMPDDILVFHEGGLGHVAVIRAVTPTSVQLIEQNWSATGLKSLSYAAATHTISDRLGAHQKTFRPIGWLRPSNGTPGSKIFQVDTGGTLTHGLEAYYNFENNFADFYSTNNLSQNPPAFVGFDNGKIGLGANSVEGGEASGANFLFVNSNLGVSGVGADFTIACWVKMNQSPPSESTVGTIILTHVDSASKNRKVLAIGRSLDTIHYPYGTYFVAVSYSGGLFEAVFPFNAISDGQFHFLVLRHIAGVMEVWADNVRLGTVNANGTGGSGGDQFTIFSVTPYDFIGIVDEAGVWNRPLTTVELSDLWNNGNGQSMIIF